MCIYNALNIMTILNPLFIKKNIPLTIVKFDQVSLQINNSLAVNKQIHLIKLIIRM